MIRTAAPVLSLALTFLVAIGPAGTPVQAAQPSRKERLAALTEEDRAWLTEFVAPIILPEEEKVLLELPEASQREGFKEDFWQRRERQDLPPPLGPGYRVRYRQLRQVVEERYDGWRFDAGRIVLRWGEPDAILTPRCAGEEVFRDLEVWTYSSMQLAGHSTAHHIFYRPAPSAPRRLWTVHDSNVSVFYSNLCRRSFGDLSLDCRPNPNDRCSSCQDRCEVYKAWVEIVKRQGGPAGALTELAQLFNYPRVPTEGLDRPKARWAAAPEPQVKTAPIDRPSRTAVALPTSTSTPDAARQATPAPTPPAAAQPTETPAPQPTRSPALVRTPTPARPTPAPTRAPTHAATRAPTPKPTAARPPTPAPTQSVERLRRLSPEEIRERIGTLEPEYREFVELARPLLTEDELSRFLQLSGHDKDAFIRDFWKRHS